MHTRRAVLLLLACLAPSGCDDKAAPGAGVGTAPAAGGAAPGEVRGAPASIPAVVGAWVLDVEATTKAMTDASKIEALKQGAMQFSDEQLKAAIDETVEGLRRSDFSIEVKPDGTYVTKGNGLLKPILGTVTVSEDVYTFIPDDNSGVVRTKIINGRLTNVRPRDPAAPWQAVVWKRR